MYTRRYRKDPYRELELYLQQAQDEIGKAFESLLESTVEQPRCQQQIIKKRRSSSPPPTTLDRTPVHRKLSSPSITSANLEYNVNHQNFKLDKEVDTKDLENKAEPVKDEATIESKAEGVTSNLPSPPSGDIELLTEWVDTFVEAINTSLNVEDVDEFNVHPNRPVDDSSSSACVTGTSSQQRPLFIPISQRTVRQNCENSNKATEKSKDVTRIATLGETYKTEQTVTGQVDKVLFNLVNSKASLEVADKGQTAEKESSTQNVNIFSYPKEFRRDVSSNGHDAVTQTTPHLSRSSSITGVTECSEEAISITSSEDSIPRFSASESSTEFQTAESSSSLSSDDDTRVANGKQKQTKAPNKSELQRKTSGTPPANSSPKEKCPMREVLSEACLAPVCNGTSKDKALKLRINELNFKSSSAPLLEGKFSASSPNSPVHRKDFDSGLSSPCKETGEGKVTVPARSRSVQELTEIEALEACSWLRAAGFPQYAHMYEDNLFPIDISNVQKDHDFLDADSIQSLFRRLNTLNKCARMKIDNIPRKSFMNDDSDDEDLCALSENWQFQRSSRRWSRIPHPLVSTENTSPKYCNHSPTRKYLTSDDVYSSSHDSVFVDDQQSSPDSLRKALSIHYQEDVYFPSSPIPMEEDCRASGSGSGSSPSFGSDVTLEKQSELLDITRNLRRTGSERLRDSARALLRRMESLRGKRKKKHNRHAIVIGPPQGLTDSGNVSMSPDAHGNFSPHLTNHPLLRNFPSDDINGHGEDSDCSQNSTPQFKHRKRGWRILSRGDMDSVVHSDSECPDSILNYQWKDSNSNNNHIDHHGTMNGSMKHTSDSELIHKITQKPRKRERSYLEISESNQEEKEERLSVYDNVPAPLAVFDDMTDHLDEEQRIRIEKDGDNIIIDGRGEDADSGSIGSSMACSSDKETSNNPQEESSVPRERRDSGVGSSLTRTCNNGQTWWHCFPHRQSTAGIRHSFSSGLQLNALSAPQLMVLRKLSLLKLTTLMEKHSPSSRSGWNWGVPKFIRKIRAPDYKDKVVFGVPLLVVLQRSGQPLPAVIQSAIRHLQKTSIDCNGLFRKSGVRSRIQKLRNLSESNPDSKIYESQQAYDIADMLKQYFRELPEALLTNKLSEIFLAIFQHIPEELRKEAMQAAILLMPDENREVLQSLLSFLQEVSTHSDENQMTATNLAVCFAPSLFHLNSPRSASASPRRTKTAGVPDQRELNENRAAHECLTHMIKEYRSLFTISEDTLGQCRSLYLEEWEPATLEDIGKTSFKSDGNWKVYVDNCIQGLLKEARDKFKGWIPVSQNDVEIAYKKLTDRHPLRLWKVSIDVEAPPIEVLNRILRERHVWDDCLLKWRVVARIDKQSEIFQYVRSSFPPHPPRDYCILRSWRTDLPKGTCVLVETSVEHSDAPTMLGGVRGIALASHYLIEPCGSGKSKVTYISRIDTRGRTPEWYNKAYGQICALQMLRLKNSFAHGASGPETKV